MSGLEKKSVMNASRVLRRLVEIEEEGMTFYEEMSKLATSPWTRKFAKWLCDAEEAHRKYFLRMAERAEANETREDTPLFELADEVLALLSARVLPSVDQLRIEAPYTTDTEAVRLAIQVEDRAFRLMARLTTVVAREQRGYMERVVQEELDHKTKLEELLGILHTGRPMPDDLGGVQTG
jgi:rubrerythrin